MQGLFQGCRVKDRERRQRFVDPPGQQWNDFVHDCDELVAGEEGRLRMIIGDQSWEMEPGDEIFIPKGAVHSVHNLHAGRSRWLYGYN